MKIVIVVSLVVLVLLLVFICWCLMRAASLEDRWLEEHGFEQKE